MNKYETLEDIKAIIDDRCEAELGQVHASSKGGEVTKTVGTSLIAKDIYNAGYRKVSEDEIVIKKSEYEALANDLDKGDYGEFENGFSQGHKQAKQETAREVSDKIYNKLTENDVWHDMKKIWWRHNNECYELKEVLKQVLKELGIELE